MEKVCMFVTVREKRLEFLTVAVQFRFNCYTIAVFPFSDDGKPFV